MFENRYSESSGLKFPTFRAGESVGTATDTEDLLDGTAVGYPVRSYSLKQLQICAKPMR